MSGGSLWVGLTLSLMLLAYAGWRDLRQMGVRKIKASAKIFGFKSVRGKQNKDIHAARLRFADRQGVQIEVVDDVYFLRPRGRIDDEVTVRYPEASRKEPRQIVCGNIRFITWSRRRWPYRLQLLRGRG